MEHDRDDARNRLASALNAVEAGSRALDELARLRNEVTRLQNQAEISAAEAKDAKEFQSDMMQVISNTPLVRTLFSTGVLTPAWNELIAIGGWKTPSGKHAIVITRASPENDPQQLTIKSYVFEYTEDAGSVNGLAQFNTDEQDGTKPTVLSSDQFEALWKAAEGHSGIEIVAQQAVTTLSGRHTQVQTVDMHQIPSGEKYSTGPVIDVIPTITPDGQSVQMVISAHLNYPIPVPKR